MTHNEAFAAAHKLAKVIRAEYATYRLAFASALAATYAAEADKGKAPAAETVRVELFGYAGYRPWVARITGTDAKYGMAREFVRGGLSYSLPHGLYQIGGSKGQDTYFVVCVGATGPGAGRTSKIDVSDERAAAMARRMQAGEAFEAARLATRGM